MENLEINTSTPESEVFNRQHLDEISNIYGLGKLNYVSSPKSGMITENAFLVDEDGNKYFAKRYRSEDMKRHAATYRASEIVAQDERIPVVLPLLPKDGSYTVDIDGASFALFNHITHQEGSVKDIDELNRLVFNTAQALGRIHSVPVSPSEALLRPIPRWAADADKKRISTLKDILNIIVEKDELDLFDEEALEQARFKLDYLERNNDDREINFVPTICHADFHAGNVLRDDKMNIIAICDWDNSGLANPYMDFLNAFNSNVMRVNTHTEEEIALFSGSFIQGYESGRGSSIDMTAIEDTYPSFLRERVGSTWPMYQHYILGENQDDKALPKRGQVARDLAANPNELLDVIRTSV